MKITVTDMDGNPLPATAELTVRVDVPQVDPTPEPPLPPVEPEPTPEPPPVEPPATSFDFAGNRFADWPKPNRPGIFRPVPENLRYIGSAQIATGPMNGGLPTHLSQIQCLVMNLDIGTMIGTLPNNDSREWWEGHVYFGGDITNAASWPIARITSDTHDTIDVPKPKVDYTQAHCLQLPDGSILYGSRDLYNRGGDAWSRGEVPWIFRRLPNGRVQSLTLPGYNPQFYGGGFALHGRYVYLIRGGYLSSPSNACSAGPAAIRMPLAHLLAWFDAGELPTGWGDHVTVVERHPFNSKEPGHHRPPDYTTSLGWTPPPTADMGNWTLAPVWGNPAVIDDAFCWVIGHGDALGYTPADIGRETTQGNIRSRMLVIDAAEYDAVASGNKKPEDVRGVWFGLEDIIPGLRGYCCTYEPDSRTLLIGHDNPSQPHYAAVSAFEVI